MSLLVIKGLTKHFGALRAVQDVSLAMEEGELRAIIGPNGAGKTTFFNMVTGFFPPTSGSITFDGRDITQLAVAARVGIGMARTFQITEIFPELTVRENLRIGVESKGGFRLRLFLGRGEAAAIAARIDEILDLAGLEDKAERRVGELSHGDQRATEIAMALTLRPRILLLDEPTAGMGEQETYDVARLVRRLNREHGYTVLLIEHDMRVVFNLADHISVLEQGRLLAEGTPAEIAANPVVQAAYLGTEQ
jgi:branched-chain amino acid transport system ATP-binding protein